MLEGDTIRGSTRIVSPPGAWTTPWHLWIIDEAEVLDARDGEGRALAHVQHAHNLFVEAPRDGRLDLRFQLADDDLLSRSEEGDLALFNFHLPSSTERSSSTLTIRGFPEDRTWIGGDASLEAGVLRARWADTNRWSLIGLAGPIARETRGALEIVTGERHRDRHTAILDRAAATWAIAEPLGLSEPQRQLVYTPSGFSFSGVQLLLAAYALDEPGWAHVVGHEIGHNWFSADRGLAEAAAAWIATWVDDPDGTKTSAWYTGWLDSEPRCALLAPHAYGSLAEMHGGGLILTMLEDRIGRAETLAVLRAAATWWDVVDAVERGHPGEGRALEAWLSAERWPTLEGQITSETLWIEETTETGLSGTLSALLTYADGRSDRLPVRFGPGGAPLVLPPDVERVWLDPSQRLPVVLPETVLFP